MVFLALQQDSRGTTGNSGFLLCWPSKVQSSIRVGRDSWGLLLSHCRANRPYLGLCPRPDFPLQGRQESRGCFPDSPGSQASSRVETKTPLFSRVAMDISWSPLSGLKGVKPPLQFGERTRDCSPGHAGKEGPHLAMTGSLVVFL